MLNVLAYWFARLVERFKPHGKNLYPLDKPISTGKRWARPRTNDWHDLTPEQVHYMHKHMKCCYCQTGDLYEGPHGGMSVNYACGNPDCAARFNLTDLSGNVVLPWGQYTGTAPADFIERRRQELRKNQ